MSGEISELGDDGWARAAEAAAGRGVAECVGADDWAMAAAAITDEVDDEAKAAMEALVARELNRLYDECAAATTASAVGVSQKRDKSKRRLEQRLQKRRDRRIGKFLVKVRHEKDRAHAAGVAMTRKRCEGMLETAKLDGLFLMNRVMHAPVSMIELLGAINHIDHVAHELESKHGRLVFSSTVTISDEDIAEIRDWGTTLQLTVNQLSKKYNNNTDTKTEDDRDQDAGAFRSMIVADVSHNWGGIRAGVAHMADRDDGICVAVAATIERNGVVKLGPTPLLTPALGRLLHDHILQKIDAPHRGDRCVMRRTFSPANRFSLELSRLELGRVLGGAQLKPLLEILSIIMTTEDETLTHPVCTGISALITEPGCDCQPLHRAQIQNDDKHFSSVLIAIALTDVDLRSGPLLVMTQTHNQGDFQKEEKLTEPDIVFWEKSGRSRVLPLTMRMGCVALLDGRLLRASSSNMNQGRSEEEREEAEGDDDTVAIYPKPRNVCLCLEMEHTLLTYLDAISCPKDPVDIRQALRFRSDTWKANNERFLYASKKKRTSDQARGKWSLWMDPSVENVIEILTRICQEGVFVAFHLASGGATYQYFEPKHAKRVEQRIGASLVHFDDAQVYVAAGGSEIKDDAWWSSEYLDARTDSYRHYRDTIDSLIVQRCKQYSAGRAAGTRVGELCAGDGALAEALLSCLPNISEYLGLDRNKTLVDRSNKRFSKKKYAAAVKNVVLDSESPDGVQFIENAGPFDIWIASGSVLCYQVGSSDAAPVVLAAMVASLAPEGVMIVTGYTQSRLEPKLLDTCGLEIVEASVPSLEAGGLESGFARFHLFVLRKTETRNNYLLGKLMLSK